MQKITTSPHHIIRQLSRKVFIVKLFASRSF
jgi:hypothetical protein